MMIPKLEMTRGQFAALIGVIFVLSLMVYGMTGLVQSSGIVLMIIIVVAYAGILPFIFGMAIQTIFRKKTIPAYAAWTLSFVVVAVQCILTRKTSVRVLEQDIINLIVSFFVFGAFANSGFKACRAFMEGKKSKLTVN